MGSNRGGTALRMLWLMPWVLAFAAACATAANAPDGQATDAPSSASPATEPGTSTTLPADVVMQPDDFKNLHDMTKVRGFFIDNVLGRLDEAVAVAESPTGGVYPVGTVIQLIPQEAMVKRAKDFDPGSGDWEFFELEVSAEGTVISKRGGREVVNRFGGKSCADCHVKAHPDFDLVCEKNRGCDKLPIEDAVFIALQDGDPRARRTSSP